MLTETEYNQLKPFRDKILMFKQTGNYKGEPPWPLIQQIRQARGYPSICMNCTGSKANAMNDMVAFIEEYEETNGKP